MPEMLQNEYNAIKCLDFVEQLDRGRAWLVSSMNLPAVAGLSLLLRRTVKTVVSPSELWTISNPSFSYLARILVIFAGLLVSHSYISPKALRSTT